MFSFPGRQYIHDKDIAVKVINRRTCESEKLLRKLAKFAMLRGQTIQFVYTVYLQVSSSSPLLYA